MSLYIGFKVRIVFWKLEEIALIYAVLTVLHEYGHWRDFIKSGLTLKKYILEDKKYRDPFEEERRAIFELSDDNPEKLVRATNYEKMYSLLPTETAANKYAFSVLERYVNNVRKKLGYTEEDVIKQLSYQ